MLRPSAPADSSPAPRETLNTMMVDVSRFLSNYTIAGPTSLTYRTLLDHVELTVVTRLLGTNSNSKLQTKLDAHKRKRSTVDRTLASGAHTRTCQAADEKTRCRDHTLHTYVLAHTAAPFIPPHSTHHSINYRPCVSRRCPRTRRSPWSRLSPTAAPRLTATHRACS